MGLQQDLRLVFSRRRERSFPYRPHLDRHRCIFIHVPRTAGTSILQALGKPSRLGRDHLPWYVYAKANSYKFRVYFKFAFVRHPVDRARSAYRYLAAGGNHRHDVRAARVLGSFGDFSDFVNRGLAKGVLRNHPLFLPQSAYLIGEADELMVDHLGRFETLQRDIREVLGKLGIEAKLERQTSSMDEPLEPIASSALEALDSVYAQDFRAFDYRIDEYPHAR